jgi:L,D-transpeptidase catalytic domain
MTTCFVSPKRRSTWFGSARLAVAILVVMAASHQADASSRHRSEHATQAVASRPAGDPLMAIVSLHSQRVTIYDADGWILQAPVSSGQKGRETPAGIFSIIEKQEEHYSNLYDDAFMPHMERITWSGIALHGGPLPGYAASHGCIRMPYDFAERLFGLTKLGMRVIVAPRDVAPVEITHPTLFRPKPDAEAVANARAADAAEATRKADAAKLAAIAATREAARATMPVRMAENLKLRADAQVAAAERALASASSDEAKARAEDAKAKAVTRAAELEAQSAAAKAEVQPKLDAASAARDAAAAAETARATAADAAREAARALEPVSVFISRKTQRLYVRQHFQPILESEVTIRDPDRPIGTHVFTAMKRSGDANMEWSVVSLEPGHSDGIVDLQGAADGRNARDAAPTPSDPSRAKEALDRISIPQEALDRIATMASPRSSLIISDEPLSSETGKGTEFVVVMSDEPQGGIKFRRHTPDSGLRYVRRQRNWGWPFAGSFSRW